MRLKTRVPPTCVELAIELMRQESITPHDEGCQDILARHLKPLGFNDERFVFGHVSNQWARRGSEHPLVCFAGHTDVVPTGPLDMWISHPFKPEVRNGLLYGRGACDMKAPIACFVVAVREFVAEHQQDAGSIALLITSAEEAWNNHGTPRVIEALEARGEAMEYCIVGEPSSFMSFGDIYRNGQRGSLSGAARIVGVQGHVAYPFAQNPIHMGAPVIAELASTVWDNGDGDFPPTSFQITDVHAGAGAGNIVPSSLEFLFNFRYSPASTVEGLKEKVEAILRRHGVAYENRWWPAETPYLSRDGRLATVVSEVVKEVVGFAPQPMTHGGSTDAQFIYPFCPEVVVFGPLAAPAHTIDEFVAVDDLHRLTLIYKCILERLLL